MENKLKQLFSPNIFNYVQKGDEGCSPQKYCHHILTSPRRWDGSDQKGRKSKSGVVPATGGLTGQQAIAATFVGKNQSYWATIVTLQTGALTPQPDGNLQKKTWSHKKFSGSRRNRCLCVASTPPQFSLFLNAVLLMIWSLELKMLNLYWNHIGYFPETQLQKKSFFVIENFCCCSS